MNYSLYKAMMKGHSKLLITYASSVFLCLYLLVMTFPMLAKSQQFNDVIKGLPESVMVAFGIQGNLNNAVDYMAMNFYNSLYLYILMAYTILTAVQLVSRFVDRGSMAYLLSTPVNRIQVINTQALVLITGLVTVSLFTYIGGYLGVLSFADINTFDLRVFTEINLIVMLIFLVIGAYSFLFSCLFNEEKTVMGVSFGLTVLFYALSLASKLSDGLNGLKYFTIFSLYQPESISQGNYNVTGISITLCIAAVILFVSGSYLFKRKDLSI
ncbi:ABC-2 type transport system permease protein [Paenibacillus sophorae]|uniref:ABC transporter permease n=1 Tax=Paenibacillus sophorae TaxID=1333845 RepID=A0A1H8PP64_9BACL|nr:ABC transporter permease subunit [Paenibacillus sophorae]QWU16641.1 ABC transporter permease [Paenibacillus sophorae]SEO43561.1 ABC-2 type transport system permease protein [Paenibacillus sophorae]